MRQQARVNSALRSQTRPEHLEQLRRPDVMGRVQSKALKKLQGAGFGMLSAAGVFTQPMSRGPTLALKGSCGSR